MKTPRVSKAGTGLVLAGLSLRAIAGPPAEPSDGTVGWMVSGQCLSDAYQAAAASCATLTGMDQYGPKFCSGLLSNVASDGTFYYAQMYTMATGEQAQRDYVQMRLQPCETRDWAYWGPIVALFTLTMIGIACSKVIRRMFLRETY